MSTVTTGLIKPTRAELEDAARVAIRRKDPAVQARIFAGVVAAHVPPEIVRQWRDTAVRLAIKFDKEGTGCS